MEFSRKKLPRDAGEKLKRQMITELKPYELLFAPVYVFLKFNEKFVAMKGPLDFFTPEEIQKISPMEMIFFDPFQNGVQPYQDAGRGIRLLMSLKAAKENELGPSPYELSDAVLRRLGPLWFHPLHIEPFFLISLVTSVCDPLSSHILTQFREKDIVRFEKGLLKASLCVFLALTLGYCDLFFLTQLRDEILGHEVYETQNYSPLGQELLSLTQNLLRDNPYQRINGADFQAFAHPLAQKIYSRLQRIEKQFMTRTGKAPTLFGEEGLISG